MRWLFGILIFVLIGKNEAFAQAHLKNGVYEFNDITPSDSFGKGRENLLNFERKTIQRTLIVSNDTIYYRIGEHTQIPGASFGIRADYRLKLKHFGNGFSAESKAVKLKLVIQSDETIAVEVLTGKAHHFYSGGQYFERVIVLPSERKTLTFKRTLTTEEMEKLGK